MQFVIILCVMALRIIMDILKFTLILLLGLNAAVSEAQDIEVTVSGLRNPTGQIVIGIFKDEATFKKEKAYISKSFQKKEIVNGEMKFKFNLEPGIWGFALLDDENNSGLMEYNFIGIPKEGFGFSDYYHSGFTRPKFEAFKFILKKGEAKKISVRVRYM
jgi:uncharacterized protein (DUF2141 family)